MELSFRLILLYWIHDLNIQAVHMIAVQQQETSGMVFIIGFPYYSSLRSQYETLRLTIFTVENRDTEVKLCTPGLDGYSQNVIIIQGSTFKSHTVDISMRVEGVNKTMKTLLIVSDDPIIVYSWEFGGNSVETLIAFPLQTFGSTYYILTCSLQDSMSELLLIGIYDGTNITMELPDNLVDKVAWSGTLLDNNRTIIDNLNLFETIQVQARGDLSGTYVEASKAIGVIVANERTKLVSNGYQDNVLEMIPSVEKWGTHFICVGTPQTRRTDIVKVLSSEPHTNVRVDGSVDNDFTMTKSGDIFSIDLPIGGSVEIAADKPVLVAQYYTQDPAMAIVPPVEQWEENYTIAIPYNNSFENYLIVVARGPDVSKITLDGMPLNATFERVYSDFWKAIVRVFQGKYVLSNEREATFGVLIFGYISIQSYFIPAGMKHRNISAHAIGNQINNGQQAFLDLNRSIYCPVLSFEMYMSKLNPQCDKLWQRPRDSFLDSDEVWYCNSPVGEKKLSTFLSSISKALSLSTIYTNHSIRATGASILSKCMYGPSQVMVVTGHKSVQSLSVYQRVSDEEKLKMGESLTENVLPSTTGLPALPAPSATRALALPSVPTESVRTLREIQSVEYELSGVNMDDLFSDFSETNQVSLPAKGNNMPAFFNNCSVTINNLAISYK